jgi:hypothetical protein
LEDVCKGTLQGRVWNEELEKGVNKKNKKCLEEGMIAEYSAKQWNGVQWGTR